MAVPLMAPSGAVGVLSAELRESPDVDAQPLAIATIVAAQLSKLLANATAPVASTVSAEVLENESVEASPAQQTAQG